MTYEELLTCIRQFEHLAKHADDKSIREKSAELASNYRQLAEIAKRREAVARRELAS